MGKTKTKLIDDSLPQGKPKDKLVEKLKAELGIKEASAQPIGQSAQTSGKGKKAQPQKEKPRSKKYQDAVKNLDKTKTYPLTEAVELTKKFSYTKFNGTLEVHINTHHTGIRGLVSLPFALSKTEYKTEPKAAVIHIGLGKLDQPTEELSANIKTLLTTIGKTKIKKVALTPTMGPSVKVDLSSI